MNTPKVVIFMSCYNHEAYVREAMDSVINQTYPNWELYVVNDASTDNTGKILETYKDERIHYYDFKENTAFIGAASFLQDLLVEVEAKYINIFSSDDKWDIHKLQKQVEILESCPEYKCCFTWDKLIFESENDYYQNLSDYSHRENDNRYEWINQFYYYGNCMNACSALMDKEVFYELGTMNQNYRQLADFRLWFRLACKFPFYILQEELTYYRRHSANLSIESQESNVRSGNEHYRIIWELFNEINNDTFYRAFYKQLPYSSYNTEEDFLAAKFIVLVNRHTYQAEQVAIDFYLKNCGNQAFIDILQDKYDYKPQNFLFLTGNGGMQYRLINKVHGSKSEQEYEYDVTPADILVNSITAQKLNADNITDYSYVMLLDLADKIGMGELFENISNWIFQIRSVKFQEQKSKKVVFIMGEGSEFDILNEMSDVIEDKLNECYYSIIPTRSHMFQLDKKFELTGGCYSESDGVSYVSVYDEEEHCLKLLKDADIIYYIDCINDNYEFFDIMAGCSLAVEQNGIMNIERYQDMIRQNSEVLKLFDTVFTYE